MSENRDDRLKRTGDSEKKDKVVESVFEMVKLEGVGKYVPPGGDEEINGDSAEIGGTNSSTYCACNTVCSCDAVSNAGCGCNDVCTCDGHYQCSCHTYVAPCSCNSQSCICNKVCTCNKICTCNRI